MELDLLALSRLQFTITIMFHYIFPPLTIGLATIMVFTEGMYLRTKDLQYEVMTKFWTRLFGANFAVGVATGIVMEFQFGTNWDTYSRFVGDVFGSALAAEGIFAFFLESGFLAVLVFGWDRVSTKMHFFSTVMVWLGSIFSATWIVIANSWQHTPAGYHIVTTAKGFQRAEITDFWALVFNPSSTIRLTHVLIGAVILGAFFVMSITGYYILRNRHVEMSKKSFSVALILAAVASLAQLVAGDVHARQVAQWQPAKLAAYEGHYKTGTGGTPIHLFGIPSDKDQKVYAAVTIPTLLSWMVHRNGSKPVTALDAFPKEDRPPVAIPFYSFHVMVGLGMYFIGLTVISCFWLWRGVLFQKRWLLWVYVFSVIAPYFANQLGWVGTEVGRQPWVVQGLLRTGDAYSKSLVPGQVLASIVMFGIIYALLFAVWVYVLNDKIHQGPEVFYSSHDDDVAPDTNREDR
ncbi:MAG: cytochrome ubiquinol oxidase subunit I [Armatimonadota bacterium]